MTAMGPLAARMRPRTLEEVWGQEHLLGPGKPLRRMIEGGRLGSCILWGPPGSGKTTVARLLASRADAHFVPFSAVTEGVARVREVLGEARERKAATGKETILFCDEIHRFNKSQQDAFLPHVEDGTLILVGATTENPSFEVNRPLLSRAPVYLLHPLSDDALRALLTEALRDPERGLGGSGLGIDDEALELLAKSADGDARRALGALELAATLAEAGGTLTSVEVREALQHRFALFDKGGEEHYNLISALHKSVRGSHPDAALYWLARMLRGGADGGYVARRLIRMAVEDVGLADPTALPATLAARDAWLALGSPEGDLALAQAVVHLATAPKSNRVYLGWKGVWGAAEATASAPIPPHLRNAPTSLLRSLGYGVGYRYDPDEPHGISAQPLLPSGLEGKGWYLPGPYGFEREIEKRLRWWEARRAEARAREATGEGELG
jgi:putative ATPase